MKKITIQFVALAVFFLSSNVANSQWSELGGSPLFANSSIFSVCTDAVGNIYAAGAFTLNSSNPNRIVRKFDGSSWSLLGGTTGIPANGDINALCSDAAGNIYAAGNFINGSGNKYVSKWNGNNWNELGGINSLSAILSPAYSITAICSSPSGNIYVAGAEGLNTSSFGPYVARWNGGNWSKLADKNSFPGQDGFISTLCYTGGTLYAGGSLTDINDYFYVAAYSGTGWYAAGSLQANNTINSLCTDKFGYVYAGGFFTNSSGKRYVARLDAGGWSELGAPNTLNSTHDIYSVCSDALGNIYAAESFHDYFDGIYHSYIAKYNGSTWSELGNNPDFGRDYIYSVCSDASGNVYAGGTFVDSYGYKYVAKYTSPIPSISISDKSVTEGNSGTTAMKFKVTLSAASASQVKVNYATTDSTASAPADYTATSGTLKFKAGQTSKSITVFINGDMQKEKNEKLKLILSQPVNATIADGLGVGTIKNDDDAFAIDNNDEYQDAAIAGNISIKVSPNPAKNQITVSGLKAGIANYIKLVDISGRSLFNRNVTFSTEIIDISKYAQGIYILQYYNGSKNQQVKIIKE